MNNSYGKCYVGPNNRMRCFIFNCECGDIHEALKAKEKGLRVTWVCPITKHKWFFDRTPEQYEFDQSRKR
jgi:hypothetical protein